MEEDPYNPPNAMLGPKPPVPTNQAGESAKRRPDFISLLATFGAPILLVGLFALLGLLSTIGWLLGIALLAGLICGVMSMFEKPNHDDT